jgi:hypothetical protein
MFEVAHQLALLHSILLLSLAWEIYLQFNDFQTISLCAGWFSHFTGFLAE